MEKEQYIRYKLEGFLDLEELGEKFELSVDELCEFHNSYCTISEYLSKNYFTYLEYIYLPVTNYTNWKEKQLISSSLPYPTLKSKKRYGIVFYFLPQDLSIHYETIVNRDYQLVEIDKQDTFIDNQLVDLMFEQMLKEANQVIYPLQLEVDKKGMFQNIINEKEIKKRWKESVLPLLQSYYQSKLSDEILDKLDIVFSEMNSKKDMLWKNLFFQIYFAPIYQDYPNFEYQSQFKIYFSSLQEFVEYSVKYDLQKEYSSQNKIVLKITGVAQSDEKHFGLTYKFHKETHEIFSVIGDFSIQKEDINHTIHFELYELH
ncbi:hypothetical protein [Empedobacter tilapiae]